MDGFHSTDRSKRTHKNSIIHDSQLEANVGAALVQVISWDID